MKIATVGHFSKMMPLLIGWTAAADTETRTAAIDVLLEIDKLTWPRGLPIESLIKRITTRKESDRMLVEVDQSAIRFERTR